MLTSRDSAVTTVAQSLLYTGSESGKLMALRNLVAEGKLPYPSLIFVQSVQRAEELHNTLVLDGLRVESVHGNRTASQRDAAVAAFRKGEVFMLVVTEVLARGMDFRGVKVVVNYGKLFTIVSSRLGAPIFAASAQVRKEPSYAYAMIEPFDASFRFSQRWPLYRSITFAC